MNLSVMTVMLLVAMIGNNTATLTTTAKLSLSTTEAMIIAQTTTEAFHTTPATNTASTNTTNTTTASNAANITTSDEVNASTSSLLTISYIVPEPSTIKVSSTTAEIPEKTLPATTTSNIRTTPSCQNGGIYDNGICKCSSSFEGKLCETIKNIITVDNGTTVSFNVDLRFTNMEFTENLKDITSEEYKEFEKYFKRNMSIVYVSVAGFSDVKILSISEGSIIVLHEVIVRFLYKPGVNIAYQFREALKDVQENLVELSKNCNTNPEMCIADNFEVIVTTEPLSPEELCRQMVEEGFKDFFTPEFENGNLICVSHCGEKSSRFKGCHEGSCHIEKWTGPRCFCPGRDLYLYADNQCGGKISKLGLFIGGGVALAVLVIITITLGICLYRAKSQMAQSNELFYETVK